MPRIPHLHGLLVLGAAQGAVVFEQVLIPHDKMGGLPCHTGPDIHPGSRRHVGRHCARHAKRARENHRGPRQRPRGISRQSDRRRLALFHDRLDQVVEGQAQAALGMLHDHGRRAGVLSRVVVVEPKVQHAFEVCQPMPSVPLQFGPSPPCDRDAVAPAQIGNVQAAGPAGGIHRLLVKVAVLHKLMARQQGQQHLQRLGKAGGLRHMVRADAVQTNVERVEPRPGVDQHRKRLDFVVQLHAGQADLTDACRVAARRLDVQRDEAKVAHGNLIGMAEGRPGSLQIDPGRRQTAARPTSIMKVYVGHGPERPIEPGHPNPRHQGRRATSDGAAIVGHLPARCNRFAASVRPRCIDDRMPSGSPDQIPRLQCSHVPGQTTLPRGPTPSPAAIMQIYP